MVTTTETAPGTGFVVDVQFMLKRISVEFTEDRYASAMYLARRDAIAEFVELYGREPDMERCVIQVQNASDRVSLRLEEVAEEPDCRCGCHSSDTAKKDQALENLLNDPDIGTSALPWKT